MHLKHFEAGPVGIKVAEMHRIAVPKPCRIKARAVVIDGHRAVNDLILPVTIDIRDAQAVIPLSGITGVSGIVAVKRPKLRKPAVAEVVGDKHRSRLGRSPSK